MEPDHCGAHEISCQLCIAFTNATRASLLAKISTPHGLAALGKNYAPTLSLSTIDEENTT